MAKLLFQGEPMTVWRPNESGFDGMGEPVVTWVPETVENVLWSPTLAQGLNDGDRPHGTSDTISAHFPKSYTASLAGCELEVNGERWSVIGDPLCVRQDLCPGKWNRTAVAKKVAG